jgi:hypothetical protein
MAEDKKTMFDPSADPTQNRDAQAAADMASADKAAAEKAALDAAAAALKAEADRAAMPKKGVVAVGSLHIRKDHSVTAEHTGGLVMGNTVSISDLWTDGKDTWVKIGPEQWVAMIYNGETYVKPG